MGAVKFGPYFSEFPYSASGITLVYEKVKWKEGKILLWYTADRGIITKSKEIWWQLSTMNFRKVLFD